MSWMPFVDIRGNVPKQLFLICIKILRLCSSAGDLEETCGEDNCCLRLI